MLFRVWIIVAVISVVSFRNGYCEGEGGFVEKLGEELWQLGQLVTKYAEITTKYRSYNARVDTNDGRNLTGQIVDNVGKMLKRRTQAVKCIQEKAEELISGSDIADYLDGDFSLEYFNMKYSGADWRNLPWLNPTNLTSYLNITLRKDRHFYSIPVNTLDTAVHIPTNLYDRYPEVAEAITWTAALNDTFVRNYRSDPELGWQYFGASTGMLRQFPAMKWHMDEEQTDLYDCRTRPWFIETATCSKDVIILMDNSGSMTGMRNTIAKLVVNKLLTTFGNNDFINVLNFSWTATPVVPCFDSLIQANVQNIKYLQDAVNDVKPQGNSSVPNAFEAAFSILQEARERRGCDNGTDCQQVIMLVTDGLPGNITEVFLKHNRPFDGSVPIRIFTYLLGLEVRGVQEIQDIACSNRGYYVHITGIDQVQDQVLKYIAVLARPLAFQGDQHPTRWTPLFADISDPKIKQWLGEVMDDVPQQARWAAHERYLKSEYFSQRREDSEYVVEVDQLEVIEEIAPHKEYKMMTSVAIPVFDKRTITNQTRFPELLAGVAGTDVPIDDIYKLTYPYKIGANGYAFVLTNNGHIVMHPDHRPVWKGVLKDNYNAIDLLDVEFAADEEGDLLLQGLRDAMIDFEEGDVQNVMVKFHYDDMRRVGMEKRDYYFSPLPGTGFSLGLSIPADYGDYQIGVKDVVNERFMTYPSYNTKGHPFDDYFENEWRIHPDWTYCKYKFESHKDFDSKENELMELLRKIKNQDDWRRFSKTWKAESQSTDTEDEDTCDQPFIPEDSFFCDPDLVILLIFDAMVTLQPFQEPVRYRNAYEEKLLQNYNTTLRFVATQSGLTRWQNIPKTDDIGNFGDLFPYSIHEPWFQASVLQYNLDTRGEYNKDGDSFVFSVPFDAGERESFNVMATIAIFPRDGGRKAPASVVGYQMTYDSFYQHAVELSKNYSVDCGSETKSCYIIDHNAYIVLSMNRSEVGQPLRAVDPNVLQRLLDIKMFKEIKITDNQALHIERNESQCGQTINDCPALAGGASVIDMPFSLAIRALNWIWTHLAFTLFQQIGLASTAPITEDDDEELDIEDEDYANNEQRIIKAKEEKANLTITLQKITPAIQNHSLYLLEQSSPNVPQWFIRDEDNFLNYSSLISARRIEHTNLVLLITQLPKDEHVKPRDEYLNDIDQIICLQYARDKNLKRRSLANCTVYHLLEDELDSCGKAANLKPIYLLLFLLLFLTAVFV